MTPLTKNHTFSFECTPDVPCFNQCCRNLNQFLFPYDIIRLRNHFKLSSSRFLERYTACHTGPETGLPVVTLCPNEDAELTCPFVSEAGCRVYADRPASCRIYPLARAMAYNRQTGQTREHFALLKESHCRGHENPKKQTATRWITAQQLVEYNRANDRMMALISLKNQHHSIPLDRVTARMVYTACYDLDTFRDRILTDEWGDAPKPDTQTRVRLANDDLYLLDFGLDWAKQLITQTVPRSPQHA